MEFLQCEICYDEVHKDTLQSHIKECQEFQIKTLSEMNMMVDTAYDKLLPCQIKALEYVNKKAKVHELNTAHIVKLRLINLGFDVSKYDEIKKYITEKVKVTINIRLTTILTFLDNEPILKNLFEVHGENAGRRMWENNLFNQIYSTAQHSAQVKYGALNIFQEESGIQSCRGYGHSVMVMRDKIKKRISFVNGDSACMQLHICNFSYCMQLFVYVHDDFLQKLVAKIDDNVVHSFQYPYVEAQLHGEINIDKDVETIIIPGSEIIDSQTLEKLDKFAQAHPNIEIRIL